MGSGSCQKPRGRVGLGFVVEKSLCLSGAPPGFLTPARVGPPAGQARRPRRTLPITSLPKAPFRQRRRLNLTPNGGCPNGRCPTQVAPADATQQTFALGFFSNQTSFRARSFLQLNKRSPSTSSPTKHSSSLSFPTKHMFVLGLFSNQAKFEA